MIQSIFDQCFKIRQFSDKRSWPDHWRVSAI